MSDQTEIDAVHIAPLSGDGIPDANQAHYCFSCHRPMTAVYCGHCGQRNDDYRRSIFALIKETIGSMFGLESRIWRTWGALLFRPGKVAREYADGRRMHWSSPVRVYLAMSIILFGYMGLTKTVFFSIDINPTIRAGVEKPREALLPQDIEVTSDIHFFERLPVIQARNETRDLDFLRLRFRDGIDVDFGQDGQAVKNESGEIEEEINASDPSNTLRLTLGDNEDVVVSNDTIGDFILNAVRNPQTLNRAIFSTLPKLMFFMMPLTMLLGAIFIRGPRALLYDHLVHSAYIHAVAFLLTLAGLIAARVLPGSLLAPIIWVILIIYLPISLKHMFGRGWFKTFLTSYMVGLIYCLVMIAALMGFVTYDIVQQVVASA